MNGNAILRFLLSVCMILALSSPSQAQLNLLGTTPGSAENNVALNTNIVLNFDAPVDATSVNYSTIRVNGEQSGLRTGVFSGGGTSTITFDPTDDFFPGEVIFVTITQGLSGATAGALTNEHTLIFRASSISATPGLIIEHSITTSAIGANTVHCADMDQDGDLDVFSCSYSDDKVAWYENDGSQNFTTHVMDILADGVSDGQVADIDGDGDLDAVSASVVNNQIAWYENNGSQSFTKLLIDTINSPRTIEVMDVDGDGDMDFASSTFSPTSVIFYENDGSENFTKTTVATDYNSFKIHLEDMDLDGDVDILSAHYSNRILWYENDGSQNFTSHTLTSSASNPTGIQAMDVDNDGDVDVICAEEGGNRVVLYENDGVQNFTQNIVASSLSQVREVYGADMDGDGDIDIVSAVRLGDQVVWHENDGSQNFTTHIIDPLADNASDVYVADIDSDGDLDVLAAVGNTRQVIWYEFVSFTDTLFIDTTVCSGGSYTFPDGSTQNNISSQVIQVSTVSGPPPLDSVIVTTVDVLPIYFDTMSTTICQGDSILIFGTYQTTAGIYTDSLSTANGCDSIETVILTVNPPYSGSLPGMRLCPGDSTLIFGKYESVLGTYYDTLQTGIGCDSVVSIQLVDMISDQTVNAAQVAICSGDSTTIDLGSSEPGINYYLRDDVSNAIVDGPIMGTGAGISFNTGPLANTTTYNVYGDFAPDAAIDLPAANDYVRINSPFYSYGNEITIEAWVNYQGGALPWAGQSTAGINSMASSVWIWHDSIWYVNDAGTWRSATMPSLPIGWTHVATVADSVSTRVYFNGVLQVTGPGISTGIVNNSSSIIDLGHDSRYPAGTAGRNSNVEFDRFRVWSTARTENEIIASMNACLTGSEPNLEQLTWFNEGMGTSIYSLKGSDANLINPGSNWVAGEGSCGYSCDIEMATLLTVAVDTGTYDSLAISICQGDSALIFGNYETMAGTYTNNMTNMNGCDSVEVITLTVNPISTGTDTATICDGDSYVFGTQTLTMAGIYVETFQNVSGCDSTVTLTLSVNSTNNTTDMAAICDGDSYVFGTQTLTMAGTYVETFQNVSGCDSTVTLTLSVNSTNNTTDSATICDGDSYVFGGQTLTMAGTYVETFQNVSGCDSTVTLTLSVNLVDTAVSLSGTILTANASAASYQWIDCNNANAPIAGQTGQNFTPTSSGSYAVIITKDACSDTSACINVTGVGIDGIPAMTMKIYPNPNMGEFTLDLESTSSDKALIRVRNMLGQEVMTKQVAPGRHLINLEHIEKGIFLLSVEISGQTWNRRIVIE